MSELLNRFSFVTARITGEVAIFLLLIWAVILACGISSVRAQPWSDGQRRFWVWVIICLPILGLLAFVLLLQKVWTPRSEAPGGAKP